MCEDLKNPAFQVLGYGHITPKTKAGRMGTVVYAIIGIPLMLICLSQIGALMANIFRLIYRMSCLPMSRHLLHRRRDHRSTASLIPASTPPPPQDHISITVVKKSKHTTTTTDPTSTNQPSRPQMQLRNFLYHIPHPTKILAAAKKSKSVKVPVTLVIFVFFAYNLIGSLFFLIYENWSFMDSFYFSFITLSTIGFGDLVPLATGGEAEQYKSIMCSIYVLVGLSLCVMCFDLLKEECNLLVQKTLVKIRQRLHRKDKSNPTKK